MSYAHTKQRKKIASLKREEVRERKKGNKKFRCLDELEKIGDAVRKKQDGPLLGSLEDLIPEPPLQWPTQ